MLADASAMTQVRRRSILELCGADHNNDSQAIEAWIGPADKFARLLLEPSGILIVAQAHEQVIGLGGLSGDTVTLNYVDPHYRFLGVSKALMADLEGRMAEARVRVGRLYTTITALSFYQSIGWIAQGPPDVDIGQLMTKSL
jgi:GNAT superfamily N-acetyltransferase